MILFEEGKDSSIDRKVHRFLSLTRSDYRGMGTSVAWLHYAELLGRFDTELQKNGPTWR